uniref:Uncharacterized protein n=1 Tax=Caenorhabditis japonica TaxID=281687 RepID=A0A8R1J2Z1_CAEJA
MRKTSIGGSVVECSPATRAARVRFPVDAILFLRTSIVISLPTFITQRNNSMDNHEKRLRSKVYQHESGDLRQWQQQLH